MKVVFLDIDGVINSERSFMGGAHRLDAIPMDPHSKEYYSQRLARTTADPIAAGLINKLLKCIDAHIVLSSTHRKFFKNIDEEGLAEVQTYLTSLGLLGDRCIDVTLSLHGIRGIEIQDWLLRHPDVVDYVIIDDNSDMLEVQMKNLVAVDSRVGLTAEDFREACRILGEPASVIALM